MSPVVVPRGRCQKPVGPGDVVMLNGKRRLVVDVGVQGIQFVRLGSSWCWDTKRNACAWHQLPIQVTVVRRADERSRLLAERFASWQVLPVPQIAWDAVCNLSVAAIECGCDSHT